MKTKVNASFDGVGGSDSYSSAQLYGGLGIGYRLTKQLSVGAAWDFSKPEFGDEKANVHAYSISLTFGF